MAAMRKHFKGRHGICFERQLNDITIFDRKEPVGISKVVNRMLQEPKTAIYAVRCTQIRREITSEVENNILIVVSSFFSIVHLTPHTEVIECIWITTSYLLTASY